MAASTSAADRLKVLWPEMYPGNAGVTKLDFWNGSQFAGRIHFTPLC